MAMDVDSSASSEGISLFGASSGQELKPGRSSALLVKLDDSTVQELKRASKEKNGLRFSTGATPKLRIGGRSIDLTISADAFRTELFASTAARTNDLYFTTTLSHRVELRNHEKGSGREGAGTDAALAALQSSLASYKQEKQANQTNISNAVLAPPKSRLEAAKLGKKLGSTPGGSQAASPALTAVGASRLGGAPTSAPESQDEVRTQAMKTCVLHLVAIKPTRSEDVAQKTHIPGPDVQNLLQKYAKQVEGKWQLTDRAYRELDIWKFKYPSPEERQRAIDNAVKAYDRMRLGKDDQLWQMLLPREERGKGKCLSRLHLGGAHANVSRGLTPSHQPSPLPHVEGNDSRIASTANTPRLGATTPRPGSSQGDVMKRLLAKDPKKARAAIEAKERKRKEREAAANDREGDKRPAKKQATQKANVKSAEFVHSSDDESDDGVAAPTQAKRSEPVAKSKVKQTAPGSSSSSPNSEEKAKKSRSVTQSAAHSRSTSSISKQTASPALKPTRPLPGKATPLTNGALSAPASQHKSQRGPQKHDNKPAIPLPLGAARPRVTSDASERDPMAITRSQKSREGPKPGEARVVNGDKKVKIVAEKKTKEPSTAALKATTAASPEKSKLESKPPKPQPNGISTAKNSATEDVKLKNDSSRKRKAEVDKREAPPTKHQKTTSTSQQSQASYPSKAGPSKATSSPLSNGKINGHSIASPADKALEKEKATIAKDYKQYYAEYSTLYDKVQSMQERGEKVPAGMKEKMLLMHKAFTDWKIEVSESSPSALDTAAYDEEAAGITDVQQYYSEYTKLYDELETSFVRGEWVHRKRLQQLFKMHRTLQRFPRQVCSPPASPEEAAEYEQEADSVKDHKQYEADFNRLVDDLVDLQRQGEDISAEQKAKVWRMARTIKHFNKKKREMNEPVDPSVDDRITFSVGLRLAKNWQQYYPTYAKLFDEKEDKEARGETLSDADLMTLHKMHKKLMEYRRDLQAADSRKDD